MSEFDLKILFDKYSKMVFRVCYRYTKSMEDADDLVQEAFIKANRARDSFKGDSAPSSWLYSIAVNLCLDFLRSKKRKDALNFDDISENALSNLRSCASSIDAKLTLSRILEDVEEKNQADIIFVLCGRAVAARNFQNDWPKSSHCQSAYLQIQKRTD